MRDGKRNRKEEIFIIIKRDPKHKGCKILAKSKLTKSDTIQKRPHTLDAGVSKSELELNG